MALRGKEQETKIETKIYDNDHHDGACLLAGVGVAKFSGLIFFVWF